MQTNKNEQPLFERPRYFLMTDKLTPEKRSWNMSRINGGETVTALAVRKMPYAAGYSFRLHGKDLPCRPEIVLLKYKAVVFVRGCFWYPQGRKDSGTPETNAGFWAAKLADNARRDIRNQTLSKQHGRNMQVIWKCEIHDTEVLVRITGISLYKCSKPAPI